MEEGKKLRCLVTRHQSGNAVLGVCHGATRKSNSITAEAHTGRQTLASEAQSSCSQKAMTKSWYYIMSENKSKTNTESLATYL